MTPPTHAFVGYDATGMPILILLDDRRRATSHEAAKIIRAGGRVERMTLEEALKVRMFERPSR